MLEGHKACSEFLHNNVADLLLHLTVLDQLAQDILLNEMEKVFTEKDNAMLTSQPNKEEVG